ncbi:IclR family transcriptional regulator [Piscinibacter terrae]|uniref:IclR family transcriptional regulator n=1 Tax=Piscinibacter terrae TaxID=2496871 RepID=A0A3N7HUC1_9BURK|nr:IclR family transcriptional regulator [Albitalea terrae]RQP25910.1 IclR family transcriptional regulator [Albitalea terrae]
MPDHENPTVPAPAEAPRPGDTYVQSFARGLQVIRSFSAQAPQQTLSEVAQRTGLTRAGARRILLTLEGLGYVRSNGRQFSLAPRILDLGFAYLSSLPLWNLAEPVMERLVEDVKESCSAAVLDGADVVYVLRIPTHKIMSINLGIGSRLPAYCTSMGRTLLAELDGRTLDQLLQDVPPVRRTERTIVDTAALKEQLVKVREQGWCLVDQELEEGLVSLSAPIRDRAGRAIAAMNISGQVNRTSPAYMVENFLPKLRAAAQDISRMLQHKS